MSAPAKKGGVISKSGDEGISQKRKVSPTDKSVVRQVKKTRNVDPTAELMTRLTAYKLACDIPRHGLTTVVAKSMSFIDLVARLRLVSVRDVMKNFIRSVVRIALDVTGNQQKRTLAFIEAKDVAFVGSFMIAYHPLKCFKHINDVERERNETAIEMLRLFENVWTGITNIPPGANCTFETVARDAGIFVRFFQGYIDQHELAVAQFKTVTTKYYKKAMNKIYSIQLKPDHENNAEFMRRYEALQNENNDRLKKRIGSDAIKIIEEHRTAFLKEHDATKILNAPPRCASGFDGDVSRRLH